MEAQRAGMMATGFTQVSGGLSTACAISRHGQAHFNDPTAAALVADQTVWIDDATGRPVDTVLYGSLAGFGWTYGAEVKDLAT